MKKELQLSQSQKYRMQGASMTVRPCTKSGKLRSRRRQKASAQEADSSEDEDDEEGEENEENEEWEEVFVESKPGCPDRLAVWRVFLSSLYWRTKRREGAESGVLELSSHEESCIKTPTNIYATLYNVCNRRAVTIQTNVLPGYSQQ